MEKIVQWLTLVMRVGVTYVGVKITRETYMTGVNREDDTWKMQMELKEMHARVNITWKWHLLKWKWEKLIVIKVKMTLVKAKVCKNDRWEKSPKWNFKHKQCEGIC